MRRNKCEIERNLRKIGIIGKKMCQKRVANHHGLYIDIKAFLGVGTLNLGTLESRTTMRMANQRNIISDITQTL